MVGVGCVFSGSFSGKDESLVLGTFVGGRKWQASDGRTRLGLLCQLRSDVVR